MSGLFLLLEAIYAVEGLIVAVGSIQELVSALPLVLLYVVIYALGYALMAYLTRVVFRCFSYFTEKRLAERGLV